MNISMKLVYQYMVLFFTFSPTSSHLHPLQVENCYSNSRLVVDEDDNGKFRLERVKSRNFIQNMACVVHKFEIIINILVSSFRLIWIPFYGSMSIKKISAGIVFRRQNLTSTDVSRRQNLTSTDVFNPYSAGSILNVRIWCLKSIPAL